RERGRSYQRISSGRDKGPQCTPRKRRPCGPDLPAHAAAALARRMLGADQKPARVGPTRRGRCYSTRDPVLLWRRKAMAGLVILLTGRPAAIIPLRRGAASSCLTLLSPGGRAMLRRTGLPALALLLFGAAPAPAQQGVLDLIPANASAAL